MTSVSLGNAVIGNSNVEPQKNVNIVKKEQTVLPIQAEKELKPQDKSTISDVKKGQAAVAVNFSETKSIPETYVVKKGDSLSSIAKQFYGKDKFYMSIFNENKKTLKHPNAILKVGVELKLPQLDSFEKGVDKDGKTFAKPVKEDKTYEYRKQNPISYLTLGQDKKTTDSPSPISEVVKESITPEEDQNFYSGISNHTVTLNSLDAKKVTYTDAVKVNKTFDMNTAMTTANMSSQADKWLAKSALVLKDNKTSIKLGTPEKNITINSNFLEHYSNKIKENKVEGMKEFKQVFSELGLNMNNSMLAMDDLVTNLKNDPYYNSMKDQNKTFDLSAVSDKFQLTKATSYTAGVLSHKHRQVPLIVETGNVTKSQNKTVSAEKLISDVSTFFDKKGNLKDPVGFENKVYGLLKDESSRRELINQFKLNSVENIDSLVPGITSEGGAATSQRDYNSYFAIGSVILNRALGKNIKSAAQATAKGVSLDKVKPTTVKDIMFEEGQFEVAWRKQNGTTLYGFQKSLNNAFKKGQLQEGNSKDSLEIAYEVSKDLMSGMNKVSANVDGVTLKNTGRSTAELFYFNQSRSKDYSNGKESAVSMIDKNNTHVFFKAWDEIAYFR